DIALEALEANAVAVKESSVVQSLRNQRVCHRQHDGHIRSWDERLPLCLYEVGQIITQRAEEHKLHAAFSSLAQIVRHPVAANTSRFDSGILERQSSEADEQVYVFDNRGPSGSSRQHIPEIAEDVWKGDLGGAYAVAMHRVGVAAQTIEKAMNLTLRVVKAPGTGPPG